jgi:hypothetical protein
MATGSLTNGSAATRSMRKPGLMRKVDRALSGSVGGMRQILGIDLAQRRLQGDHQSERQQRQQSNSGEHKEPRQYACLKLQMKLW